MRWMLRTICMWTVMTVVPLSTWAQTNRDRTITGKLMFDQGASCDAVKVELEVSEMQPIESVYADPSCNFRFMQPVPGSYLIHVNVDGYEEIRQRVENTDTTAMNVIQMIPAQGRITRKPQRTAPSIDV